MEPWIIGGIVGGIAGAVGAYFKVTALNAQVRAQPCPKCGQPLNQKKPGPRTWTQILHGGWTCPECGCDVERFGRERTSATRSKS